MKNHWKQELRQLGIWIVILALACASALPALADGIALPPITPDLRVPCAYAQQDEWLARVEAAAAAHGAAISHLDGVRADFDDGWLLMRKSVTAEQITLRAEADTPGRLRQLLELVAGVLPEEAANALLGKD